MKQSQHMKETNETDKQTQFLLEFVLMKQGMQKMYTSTI